jgi:hypothetical protein
MNGKEIVTGPGLLGVQQDATMARIRHRQIVALFILRPCGSLWSALHIALPKDYGLQKITEGGAGEAVAGAMTRRRHNDASLGRGIPPRRDARLEAVA